MSVTRGRFITLEGSEGVGKTTNVHVIADALRSHGIDVVTTREPGGTPLAEEIRGLLLNKRTETVAVQTELLLMFAARAQHLQELIRPALARGQWVVCDRFTDATWAYQGGGRGVSAADIAMLEESVQQGLQPDLTVYLDLDPEVAAERMSGRERDRFESENRAFFDRVRAAYLERARMASRFRVIDASASMEDVARSVRSAVDAFVMAVVEASGES